MNPFPKVIEGRTFIVKSDATPNYNCIAWAVGYDRQPIWPDKREQLGWPPDLDRNETVVAFQEFFQMVGFKECPSDELELGYEKIAIYVLKDCVMHAAKQLPNGKWTSKMGTGVDAEHTTPDILCGSGYGQVALYMRRPTNSAPPKLPPLKPPPPLIIRP